MTDRTNMVTAAATVKTACRTNILFPYTGLHMYFFLSVADQSPKKMPASFPCCALFNLNLPRKKKQPLVELFPDNGHEQLSLHANAAS
jgi:hypothetical protein